MGLWGASRGPRAAPPTGEPRAVGIRCLPRGATRLQPQGGKDGAASQAPLTRGQTRPPSPGPVSHREAPAQLFLPASRLHGGGWGSPTPPGRPGFPAAARQVPSQAGVPRTRGLLWSCHPLPRHRPTSPARPGQKLGAQNWDGSSRGPLGICPPPHSPAGPPEGQWPCEGRAHGAGLARTEDTSDPADLQSHD